MPIIAPIPRGERRLMQKAIHKTRDKNHARRLTAMLMLHRGERVSNVALLLAPRVKGGVGNGVLAAELTGRNPGFSLTEDTDDLFVGKTLLHGDVLMWLMKTLLTSGCTNQRGAGHEHSLSNMRLDIHLGQTCNKRSSEIVCSPVT